MRYQRVNTDGTWPMPPGAGPCRTWPLDPGCGCLPVPATRNGTAPPDAADIISDRQRSAIEAATEILWRLTAGRYGLCPELVRPCRRSCTRILPPVAAAGPVPLQVGGRWVNVSCGCPPARDCGCDGVDKLVLPGQVYWERPNPTPDPDPDRSAITVWIDGKPLTGGKFVLLDGNTLVRTDGGTWPTCQDLGRPVTEPGTWGIEYWRGTPVPPAGRRAMSVLACELFKACTQDTTCKLPERVQSIAREGVDYTMLDPLSFLSEGRTGLTEVDMWLAAVNPHSHRSPPGAWSPDLPGIYGDNQGLYPAPQHQAIPATLHDW